LVSAFDSIRHRGKGLRLARVSGYKVGQDLVDQEARVRIRRVASMLRRRIE